MRVAISATRSSLDAPMEEQFDNCTCFVIANVGGAVHTPLRISRRKRGVRTGVEISPMLVGRGVSVVLTGRCDPKTVEQLESAGLWVVTGCGGTVRQTLDRFTAELNGLFSRDSEPAADDGKTSGDLDQYPRTGMGGGGKGCRRRDRGVDGVYGHHTEGDGHVGGIGSI